MAPCKNTPALYQSNRTVLVPAVVKGVTFNLLYCSLGATIPGEGYLGSFNPVDSLFHSFLKA